MTVFLAQFVTIAVVHLLAVVSPGPDFAMVARNSMLYSRKVGVHTAIGIAVGILVHVAYSLLGISFIIAQSIILFSIIKYIGAGYLLYIGYKSLRAQPVSDTEVIAQEEVVTVPFWNSFKTGFLTNALNPKATLFFLALFTQIIDPATPKMIQLAYGIEMMMITLVWFVLVALFFSNAHIRTRIKKVQHYVERFTGVVLIALGIKVALAGRE